MAKIKIVPLTGIILICKQCLLSKDSSLFPFRKARNGRKARVDYLCCNACLKVKYFKWYEKNRNNQLGKMKDYYKLNINKQAELNKLNYLENKERYNRQTREWRAANPHMITAYVRNYTLSKSKRTPAWADLKATNNFYRNCPDGMSVDHIHPLHGKLINGFHIVDNLQYMTRGKNSEKSNRFHTYWIFYEPTRIRVETSGPKASVYTIDRRG